MLKGNEMQFWEAYLNTLSPESRPVNPFVSAAVAGTSEITDELLHLYLIGKKTAGSGLVEDYVAMGDPLPQVGNYWIYLDSSLQPRAILRTDRVVLNKFRDIPAEIVLAEAEGDLSVEYWKRTHAELYQPHLQKWGVRDIDEATVITEYFTIVYRG